MKKNQFHFFLLTFLAVILTGLTLAHFSPLKAVYWFFGLGFGFVIQRSRFCFASAFRDPILFGTLSLTKAVLLMLIISTIGFAAIQYNFFVQGLTIPGKIYPVGLNTALGGFLFGLGMILAGGCVCSCLARIGEGSVIYLWTLAGLISGSLLCIWSFGWWEQALPVWRPVFFPDYLGWGPALIAQVTVLAGIYFILCRMERSSIDKRGKVQRGNPQT
ncbi:YeeE/YedE thiosulfate transporter family protein [Calderihabitans maritimus]|uniref:Uncharacterized protein n=1 Tax=Calderihabitans maritimus TaxID=1246530 RepID=A0A1Z5HRS1_9FIRM|nr:YeeE/YedE thiosulfate transporter family protein [Calderihabitans maritimus]GAW92025.1 conserved membrane protein of unknown function [Calderihabitans maritimus]